MSNFIPTSQCPKYLNPSDHGKPPLPLAQIPNEEIDAFIRMMIDHGALPEQIPPSQWGRRFSVGMWLQHHGHHNGL